MPTDLTFITNEHGQHLRDRFTVLLTQNTRCFDCLVGYFFISGFHQLHPALINTEQIRILIGINTDRPTAALIQSAPAQQEIPLESSARVHQQLPATILNELTAAEDSAAIENGVTQFVAWIQSGKLAIRAYPSHQLHAKLYVLTFHDGDRDRGRVITGSSNFTAAGLVDNLEFNVELKNRADYQFALDKFNELWAQAVDVSADYVETITKHSPYAPFTPYELYLKLLAVYFRRELTLTIDDVGSDFPDGFKQLQYQAEAVASARKILDEYGGVFLADVVGLGKTYMAALLAQQLNTPCLIIAPPHLLDCNNPNAWPTVFRDFGVRGHHCESVGKLAALCTQDLRKFTTVFIDESHRFRSDSTQSYAQLQQICAGKRVVLVSATPLNNSPQDILSQIKLFQPGRNSTIPNVRNLDAFFAKLRRRLDGLDRQRDRAEYVRTVQDNARDIRNKVLKYVMIRRTRTEIAKYYGADLARQGIRFPDVADPTPLFYQFNATEARVFDDTMYALTQRFRYTRYMQLTYRRGEADAQVIHSQRNLAALMKILLVKRLESSFAAFRATLARFITTYERVITEYHNGRVFISKRHSGKIFDLLDKDDDVGIARLLEADQAEQLAAADFMPTFLTDLEQDLAVLHGVRDGWQLMTRDPKWECFRAELQQSPLLRTAKVIIFTESQETAAYLAANIRDQVESRVLLVTGETAPCVRQAVIANFDAKYHRPKDDYRILVATDILAEGVNLHRANIVVNYDIPWNPTRLIQRVGRVNRVGSAFERIHTYNFFPTDEGNDLIKLREAAEAKIHGFIQMLGADARLLTDDEEIVSHDLFTRWHSKETVTGEAGDTDSELPFLTEIRAVRDQQPALFERIKRLPNKARSTRQVPIAAVSTMPAVLSYFRQGQLDKFLMSSGAGAAPVELDFVTAATLLKPADLNEVRQPIPQRFYALLEQNKTAFITATTSDIEPAAAPRDHQHEHYIVKRLKDKTVRRCPQFTAADAQFIHDVLRLVEAGLLPKATAKTVAAELKSPANLLPMNVLAVLRRLIPAELLQIDRAKTVHRPSAPVEVIVSSYLIGGE
ncbi:helicase [Rhodoferax sp. 4810]|uniref:Helicase n=1 Tax=Thiospirillum jenense TaxID=1653858 RepID=A0A839H773_9GAMM|nr:helicase-related protein [Thiospirillum jenense]MBB1073179.1 helicase [Rhodoferax jenense]MBB1124660.1 helicase [Thiospirillum jenense]